MKGCPFCSEFKEMLKKEEIEFIDRDIQEYQQEYDMYSEVAENDLIPALLIIERTGEDYQPYIYAPDRDYNELTEAIDIINKHRKDGGII